MPRTTDNPDTHRLQQLIRDRALAFGEFTLYSGKPSNYYFDTKQVLFDPLGVQLIGETLYAEVRDDLTHGRITRVGGPEVGAIPMTAALLAVAQARMPGTYFGGQPVPKGFFVRKKPKEYGTGRRLDGVAPGPGDRVLMLEDVTTSGGSLLQAIREVEAAGATVGRVVCLVDRLQGAAAALAAYHFTPLYTVRDFGIEPDQDGPVVVTS